MAFAKKTKRRKRSVPAKRRRRSMRSNGLVTGVKGALFNTVKGAVGGLAYGFFSSLMDKQGASPKLKPWIGLGLSYVATVMAKQPAVGAGIAGAMGMNLGQTYGILSEGEMVEFVRPNTLMQRAIANRSNDQYMLSDDSVYVDENNVQVFPLSDGSFSYVYPNYLNPGFY